MNHDYIPSFCTSCYRQGRTGEQFMEFAVPGFIEKFCTPNAILTLAEYLEDYGSVETKAAGITAIEREMAGIEDASMRAKVAERVTAIRTEQVRDVYY
jgi:2-iminoacetate synthase